MGAGDGPRAGPRSGGSDRGRRVRSCSSRLHESRHPVAALVEAGDVGADVLADAAARGSGSVVVDFERDDHRSRGARRRVGDACSRAASAARRDRRREGARSIRWIAKLSGGSAARRSALRAPRRARADPRQPDHPRRVRHGARNHPKVDPVAKSELCSDSSPLCRFEGRPHSSSVSLDAHRTRCADAHRLHRCARAASLRATRLSVETRLSSAVNGCCVALRSAIQYCRPRLLTRR